MAVLITPMKILLPDGKSISALLSKPDAPRACFVFAHGAGAGMRHAFMSDLALALGHHGIATLRYQFPFMEAGGKRPDSPAVAHAAVRAAVHAARDALPGVPLVAGGKSFGGRMTSQAQALSPLEGVEGLVFVGFPLHPAGKLSVERAQHLASVKVPMLFLQGTRDALADLDLVQQVITTLGDRSTLSIVEGADHAFRVLVRSGRTDAQVLEELASRTAGWIGRLR